MNIEGKHQIHAPLERVWRDLHDPVVLQACIPGCRSMERLENHRFECDIEARYGPVKARFKSLLTIEQRRPPTSYVLVGEGKGGAGFGTGRAQIHLQRQGESTLLAYDAQFTVGGRISRLASRLMVSTTRRLSENFFDAFAARFDPPG